jgi:hypothetical protein
LNNVAQIGLALHNYEFAMEHLPPGTINKTGPIVNVEKGNHTSWMVQILSYMEQEGIARNFDISLGTYAAANAPARAMVIPSYRCPSAWGNDQNDAGTAGQSNYAGVHHSAEAPIDVDNDGVLFLNSKIRFNDIKDGASNTVMVGEHLPFTDGLGWASGTRATLRNMGLPKKGAFAMGRRKRGREVSPEDADFVGTFESAHAGTISFAFADGSVHSLSTSLSSKAFTLLGNRADLEMMGDWNLIQDPLEEGELRFDMSF